MTAALVALAAAGWAALFALAEQAPGLQSTLGDPPPGPGRPIPLPRAFLVSRLALLMVAGAAGGTAVAWWQRGLGAATVSLGAALLLTYMLGDALPHALGTLAPRLAARAVSAARLALFGFRPLLGIVSGLDRLAHRVLPSRRAPAGNLGSAQQDMLVGVLSLGDTPVADIMTPRLDIVAVEASTPWKDALDLVRRSEYSRIPVYRDSLDDIIGVLYAKDLVPAAGGVAKPPAAWHELVRPAQFVPHTKPLAVQLRDFQRGPMHLAIVVDEYGGTSGLITLEDILEEIVGEIHDEYDVDAAPQIEREGEAKFWVDGRVTLDDLSAVLGSNIEHDDVSTVGGLVYSELGRVPRPGEELEIDGFRVVVEQVVRRRIHRVYFERRPPDARSPADSETVP